MAINARPIARPFIGSRDDAFKYLCNNSVSLDNIDPISAIAIHILELNIRGALSIEDESVMRATGAYPQTDYNKRIDDYCSNWQSVVELDKLRQESLTIFGRYVEIIHGGLEQRFRKRIWSAAWQGAVGNTFTIFSWTIIAVLSLASNNNRVALILSWFSRCVLLSNN